MRGLLQFLQGVRPVQDAVDRIAELLQVRSRNVSDLLVILYEQYGAVVRGIKSATACLRSSCKVSSVDDGR